MIAEESITPRGSLEIFYRLFVGIFFNFNGIDLKCSGTLGEHQRNDPASSSNIENGFGRIF